MQISAVERTDYLTLSFAQQRLWFLAQLAGANRAYNMPLGLQLSGALDRAALCRALDRIVARHEALRTVFVQVEGEPVQRIAPAQCGFSLQEHDLSQGRDESVRQRELEQLIASEALGVFDLSTGPLIRGRLIRLEEQAHVLLITMHHIVSDGWSVGVLVRELSALYDAYVRGAETHCPS